MVHRWKETGEIYAPSRRMGAALELAIQVSGIDRHALWPAGGHHEATVGVRVDGCREVQLGGPDALEGLDPVLWCTGHADFWWRIFDGELWVDDLKTGRFYPNPDESNERHDPTLEVGANRFPQNPDSDQTKLYALAISTAIKYTGPVHTSITHWPRLPLALRHAPPTREWHLTDTTYLKHIYWIRLERLYQERELNNKELLILNPGGNLILRPGDHCRFCPARPNCLVAKDDF